MSDFVKNDSDKPRTDLLPPMSILEVAKVLGFGAKKYAPGNWAKCDSRNRYVAAALRHLLAWQAGEDTDPESGISHLAHAACSVLFALEMELRGWGQPDRLQGPGGLSPEQQRIAQLEHDLDAAQAALAELQGAHRDD